VTATKLDLGFLKSLGIGAVNSGAYDGTWLDTKAGELACKTPVDGSTVTTIKTASAQDYARISAAAHAAYLRWRDVPPPVRGEYVRRIGMALRENKDLIGRLVTLEAGKILQEGWGEAQECIDIADFAVGLSRQLYGLTIASERKHHHMRESWHPLGTVGIITAFNFPAAVWAWNAMLALVCGDACLWKPSHKTPLCALALTRIAASVLEPDGFGALVSMIIGGDSSVGSALVDDPGCR